MRFWLLKLDEKEWSYCSQYGCVVAARTAGEARLIAGATAGDEGWDAWLSPSRVTCEALDPAGKPGLILAAQGDG